MLRRIAIIKKCKKGDAKGDKVICLYSHDGKLLGRHKDKASAYRQEYAIEKNGGHSHIANLILEDVLDYMLCEGCD